MSFKIGEFRFTAHAISLMTDASWEQFCSIVLDQVKLHRPMLSTEVTLKNKNGARDAARELIDQLEARKLELAIVVPSSTSNERAQHCIQHKPIL